jgi:predicted small metal-binding protein
MRDAVVRHTLRRRSVDLQQTLSEGAAMRAIECPCGHHLEGVDDEDLFRQAREHVDRDHPEMDRSDEQLRERIAADAYDVAQVT